MSARGSLRASITAQIGHLTLAATLDTGAGTLALVGPNGGGKTTLLRALLGVVRCQRAHIEVGDVLLADTAAQLHVPVEQRGIAYVPQDYALFPHLSVRENVAFAVSSAARPGWTLSRNQLEVAVTAALVSLEITSLAERRPDGLSGGERQRVALARALSVQPRALLLDEPLAALDVHARRDVRRFLADTLEALALPTLMVTHDPADVRALASSIVVLENGKITQTGTWDELVAQPASRFVAEFVADPQR